MSNVELYLLSFNELSDEILNLCAQAWADREIAIHGSAEWHKRSGEVLAYGKMICALDELAREIDRSRADSSGNEGAMEHCGELLSIAAVTPGRKVFSASKMLR